MSIAFLKKQMAERRANGLCIDCGAAAEVDRLRCENCLRRLRIYRRAVRKKRIKDGVCIQCGCERLNETSTRLCSACCKKKATYNIKETLRRAKVHAVEPDFCGSSGAFRFSTIRGAVTCMSCLRNMGEEI